MGICLIWNKEQVVVPNKITVAIIKVSEPSIYQLIHFLIITYDLEVWVVTDRIKLLKQMAEISFLCRMSLHLYTALIACGI